MCECLGVGVRPKAKSVGLKPKIVGPNDCGVCGIRMWEPKGTGVSVLCAVPLGSTSYVGATCGRA